MVLLHHLGEHELANRLSNSVLRVCAEGTHLTGDLGGHSTTQEYGSELVRQSRETQHR